MGGCVPRVWVRVWVYMGGCVPADLARLRDPKNAQATVQPVVRLRVDAWVGMRVCVDKLQVPPSTLYYFIDFNHRHHPRHINATIAPVPITSTIAPYSYYHHCTLTCKMAWTALEKLSRNTRSPVCRGQDRMTSALSQ